MALSNTQKASCLVFAAKTMQRTAEGPTTNASLANLDGVAYNAAATTASLGASAIIYGRGSLFGMRLNKAFDNKGSAEIAALAVADAIAVNALSLANEAELIGDVCTAVRASAEGATFNATDYALEVSKYTTILDAAT